MLKKEEDLNELMSSLEYLIALNNYPYFVKFLGYSKKDNYN